MEQGDSQSSAGQHDSERQRRLDALRDLAGDVTEQAAPAAAPASRAVASLGAPRRRWRVAFISGVVICALVVVGVVGALVRGPLASLSSGHSAPSITTRIVTLVASAKLYCPTDAVWSPDGRQVAVLGQISALDGQCGYAGQESLDDALNSSPGPFYDIGIIDAQSGRLVKTLPFALPALSKLCGGPCPSNRDIVLLTSYYSGFDALSWSPDGAYVGFYFGYAVPGAQGAVNGERLYGALILVPTDGSGQTRTLTAKAFLQPGFDKPYSIKLQHTPPLFTWNLKTGVGSYSARSGEASDVTTPFAGAYGWTASGQIALQNGGGPATFSPWIGGQLRPFNSTSRVMVYTADLWRWSPDGQYVAPHVSTEAYLRAPGVLDNPPDLESGQYAPPLVSGPDKALTTYLGEISQPNLVAQVAWSPNGKLFAGLDCQTGATAARLTVRRAGDGGGKLTTSFTYAPTQYSQHCDGDMQGLSWSADNASIASCDATTDQVVIWRYHA